MKTKTNNVNFCTRCINDCVIEDDYSECPNFVEGLTPHEYWTLLKDNNVNLKKMCKDYKLKLSFLYDMLNGKTRMKYKYAISIFQCINKRNYIPERSMAEVEEGVCDS